MKNAGDGSGLFAVWRLGSAVHAGMAKLGGDGRKRLENAAENLAASRTIRRPIRKASGRRVYLKDRQGRPDPALPLFEILSEPDLETRIAAIAELSALLRECPALHLPVLETLSGYIRAETDPSDAREPMREDIAAALAIITKRGRPRIRREAGGARPFRIDLREANLAGACLRDCMLGPLLLDRANLAGADLRGADLEGASLNGCDLTGADLRGTRLSRAQMLHCRLVDAKLIEAELDETELSYCKFDGLDLSKAVFDAASLLGCSFDGSNLTAARFDHATIRRASFAGARLDAASFRGARACHPGYFEEASGCREGPRRTILPQGIEPPAHWPARVPAATVRESGWPLPCP